MSGCLLVEEEGRLVGVFSDRDVLKKVALEYDQMKDTPVSELMTKEPVFVYESSRSAAALSVMAVSGFRHVPGNGSRRQDYWDHQSRNAWTSFPAEARQRLIKDRFWLHERIKTRRLRFGSCGA